MQKLLITSILLWSSFCLAADNDRVRLVPLPESPTTRAKNTTPKQVPILPVKLSPAMLEMQKSRLSIRRSLADNTLPTEKDLGMNHVPVLDQGHYGTCVTFAITAAIDAAYGKGDYISQLCLLQLSNTLSEHSYWDSAWNGSMGHRVIGEIRQYGIMTKADQKKGLCNNIKDYPSVFNDSLTQHKMTLADYHKKSLNILSNSGAGITIEPQVLFKLANVSDYGEFDRFITITNFSDGWVTPEESQLAVRRALAQGDRVVIAFLINTKNMLAGRNKIDYDTWFVTRNLKEAFNNQTLISEEMNNWGYHEIVLYGYDDNVVITNSKGETQKGVFLVRNSWGTNIMSRGVEFMTYDYFKLMALDGFSIYAGHNK